MKMRAMTFAATAAVLTIGAAAHAGFADFSINSLTQSTDGVPIEDFTLANYAFGSTDYIDAVDDGVPATFHIEANSGVSQRVGFDYELSLNYGSYDIGFFLDGSGPGLHQITLSGVSDAGNISDVFVKDISGNSVGTFSTNGTDIFFEATVEDILAVIGPTESDAIVIQWAVVPAPGAFALLGMAGLASRRRRRA